MYRRLELEYLEAIHNTFNIILNKELRQVWNRVSGSAWFEWMQHPTFSCQWRMCDDRCAIIPPLLLDYQENQLLKSRGKRRTQMFVFLKARC